MAKHTNATKVHRINKWEFADAAAREAGTGYTFTASDVGKLGKQLDDRSYWELTDDSPLTWALCINPAAATAADVSSAVATAISATLLGTRLPKTGAYTVVLGDKGAMIDATSGTWTLTLTDVATLGDAFRFAAFNSGSGVITIDGDGSEEIRDVSGSSTTKTLAQGEGMILQATDAGWIGLKFAASVAPTLDSLTIHGSDIASASTVDLDSATGDLVDVTGTTTITALTLSEGRWRTVRFTGILTLTHGSSLVLPGAANITTAAGDFAIFRGYATGVVRCIGYTKANGQALVGGSTTLDALTVHGSDIASASTTNLDTATGDLVDVTGTTTITAVTLSEGRWRTVRFTGILTLTHGSSLVLPGGANITTAAGDYAQFRGYGSSVVRCVSYTRADGTPLVGAGASSIGLHTIYVPAVAMMQGVTDPCEPLAVIATATNSAVITTLNFSASAEKYAEFAIAMPKSWNAGTVTAQFLWSHPSTTTNFGVAWQLQGVAVSDNDSISAAYGTGQVAVDTGGTTDKLYISPVTSAITLAGTPAQSDMVFFRVFREVGNASDNMAVVARLHGVRILYTTNAATDA